MTLEFFLTSLVVVILPGTGVLYTLAIGLSRGFKMSVMAAVGCTLGIVPAALASVVGLAAILHTSALAFQVIKYAGVAYLFYMAWGILREGGALDVEKAPDVKSTYKTIRDGALLNVLNPKLSLFFLAFLPQFVPASVVNPTPLMLSLAAVFMAMTFVVFVAYGACAALTRDFVLSRPSVLVWLRRGFAGTFGFLGLKLALSDR
ncbi:LysE family translocator [Maritalea myrionectae]|uniref:LysE family translocator n=1 Tax=Maritalea myrionectae TaxID=454601 RepID=UPI000401C6C6|nr:LysE family translocator [Maritalea myrionectae]